MMKSYDDNYSDANNTPDTVTPSPLYLLFLHASLRANHQVHRNRYSPIHPGTYSVDTTQSYGNNPQFTISLVNTRSSFKYISNLKNIGMSFNGNNEINITTFGCSATTTTITVCVLTSSFNLVQSLDFRYIVLDNAFSKITHFYRSAYFYTTTGGSTVITSATPIVSNFNLPAISLTGTVKVWAFFNGANFTSPATNTLRLEITAQYISSSVLQITTKNLDSVGFYLKTITYLFIGFNVDSMKTWPFPTA